MMQSTDVVQVGDVLVLSGVRFDVSLCRWTIFILKRFQVPQKENNSMVLVVRFQPRDFIHVNWLP